MVLDLDQHLALVPFDHVVGEHLTDLLDLRRMEVPSHHSFGCEDSIRGIESSLLLRFLSHQCVSILVDGKQ